MGVFYTGSSYLPVLFFGTTAKGICYEIEPKQLITVWWVAGNELPQLMILLSQGSILPLSVNILSVIGLEYFESPMVNRLSIELFLFIIPI